ncbi:Uncharacterised protein [Pasteurella canis]|nr:Uncharacterised protein [Pasteurella canis]
MFFLSHLYDVEHGSGISSRMGDFLSHLYDVEPVNVLSTLTLPFLSHLYDVEHEAHHFAEDNKFSKPSIRC